MVRVRQAVVALRACGHLRFTRAAAGVVKDAWLD